MYEYQARLAKLVDGDTIHCAVDVGLDISINLTLRFYGVNAPEMSTVAGQASAVWVANWFAAFAPDGKFILQTVKDKREKYGRYLAVILSMGRAHNLNDELVAAGQAVPYMVK